MIIPLTKLEEGTRILSAGNLDHRILEDSQDELGLLSKAFNAMGGKLNDSYKDLQKIALHDTLTGFA